MPANSDKPIKISVKIWRPIANALTKKIRSACLRRDAYLEKVLEIELEQLNREVSIPNSQSSYDYVQEHLSNLDTILVSLALSSKTTARLSEICTEKRIVRDAFFNRLFLLLSAPSKTIDALLFGSARDDWRREVWSESKHDGPFFQNGFYPLAPKIDPFWAIREGMAMYAEDLGLEEYIEPSTGQKIRAHRNGVTGMLEPEDSLYTTYLDQVVRGNSLIGVNCYVPDWRIPGHNDQKKHQDATDSMLEELGAL